jgi:hypothetical protein
MKEPSRALASACVVAVVSSLAILAATILPCLAESPPTVEVSPFSLAIVPVKLLNADTLVRQKGPDVVEAVFTRRGFTVMERGKVFAALPAGSDPTGVGLMPTDAMADLGRQLGVRFVLCGEIRILRTWRTNHLLGRRANCELHAVTRIVDAGTGEVVFSDDKNYRTDGSSRTSKVLSVFYLPAWGFMGGHLDTQEVETVCATYEFGCRPFFERYQPASAQK